VVIRDYQKYLEGTIRRECNKVRAVTKGSKTMQLIRSTVRVGRALGCTELSRNVRLYYAAFLALSNASTEIGLNTAFASHAIEVCLREGMQWPYDDKNEPDFKSGCTRLYTSKTYKQYMNLLLYKIIDTYEESSVLSNSDIELKLLDPSILPGELSMNDRLALKLFRRAALIYDSKVIDGYVCVVQEHLEQQAHLSHTTIWRSRTKLWRLGLLDVTEHPPPFVSKRQGKQQNNACYIWLADCVYTGDVQVNKNFLLSGGRKEPQND
jgi:hypothetical protein